MAALLLKNIKTLLLGISAVGCVSTVPPIPQSIVPPKAQKSAKIPAPLNYMPCTGPWFSAVNHHLAVLDQQGHGPDNGSAEWRSVVEFKLELKDKPNRPELLSNLLSNAWCDYIQTVLKG
ncbi:MAG: hypothetical protein HRU23_07790 [Gammaproteobacteria bacterium]|nr:hypothetical protein [Gammaproteobacteria bacterium]